MNSHSEILRDERLFVYLTGTVYSLQTVSELAISYITCSSPWAGHRNSVVASSRQSPTTLGIHSFWQFVTSNFSPSPQDFRVRLVFLVTKRTKRSVSVGIISIMLSTSVVKYKHILVDVTLTVGVAPEDYTAAIRAVLLLPAVKIYWTDFKLLVNMKHLHITTCRHRAQD